MSAQRHRAGWAAQHYSLGQFWGEILQIAPQGQPTPQTYFSTASVDGGSVNREFPPSANGESPRWLLLSTFGPLWIKFGDAGTVVAAATGMYVPVGHAVFDVSGFTHIARMGDGHVLNSSLAALENQ